ncbi:MAG TPA: oxidoreductase [Variovorax sp.]|nr:oxidoreductase [Variovorax sp.]
MSEPPVIPVGLVGYGFAGQTFHAPVLSAAPGLRLVAVASSQPDKVRADWPQAAVAPDVQAMLAAHPAIELVVVAAPNEAHFPVAKAALEAGRHVVVDKPFTLDAGQARELAALAQARGKLVSVYQNRRFDSDFLTLKELLASDQLGRPVYFESHFDRYRPDVRVRWREQKVPGAGLWVDLGAHLADQALQLFGKPDTMQVDVAALRDGAVVEDYFHAVLRYESGPHAPLRVVLHATNLAADPAPRYILHGTRGSYVKHGVDPQEDVLRTGARPGGEGWGVDAVDGLLTLIGDAGQPQSSRVPTQPGDYVRYYAAIRDAIRGQGPNPVPPEQAVQLMEMLDLGRQSANEGRALRP